MSTKNNPGPFDCYANAEPDEPMFILLGRDRHAAAVVRHWVQLRMTESIVFMQPNNTAKLIEARQCADAMDQWRDKITMAPFDIGQAVMFKPESRIVGVTSCFKSTVAPSGWMVEGDGGSKGVAASTQRTGLMCASNFVSGGFRLDSDAGK